MIHSHCFNYSHEIILTIAYDIASEKLLVDRIWTKRGILNFCKGFYCLLVSHQFPDSLKKASMKIECKSQMFPSLQELLYETTLFRLSYVISMSCLPGMVLCAFQRTEKF